LKINEDSDAYSMPPAGSSLSFVYKIIKRDKRPPKCEENHDWMMISGKGYDYNSDYYLCKKCERKIFRYDWEHLE